MTLLGARTAARRPAPLSALFATFGAGTVLALGCGGGGTAPAATAPTTGDVFGGATCKAVRNPREPKLTAWDPEERAQINAVRQSGVVAVRYALKGCNVELEVLPNCVAKDKGKYEFTPTPSVKQDYVRTQQDLFAELPLGASSLSGKLEGNQVLRTDYTLVGVASLQPGLSFTKQDLVGDDCERATHVVARIYLGGFAMAAGEEQSLRAEASLFGAGFGGGTKSSYERVFSDGNAKACEQAKDSGKSDPLCSVPLRIGLLPLLDLAACPKGSDWDGEKCTPVAQVTAKPAEPQTCKEGMQPRGGECVVTRKTTGSLTDSLTGDARRDYDAGKLLFNDGDHAGAATKFMAAYEASGDVRLLWNVAACEKNLRNYARTDALLRRYLWEGAEQLSVEDKAEAASLLQVLAAFISEVRFEVTPPGATVTVDDRVVGQAPLTARLDMGTRRVRIEKAGLPAVTKTLGLSGGNAEIVKVTLGKGP